MLVERNRYPVIIQKEDSVLQRSLFMSENDVPSNLFFYHAVVFAEWLGDAKGHLVTAQDLLGNILSLIAN